MTERHWVLGLSLFVMLASISAAAFSLRASKAVAFEQESWDGVTPFEMAFHRARKRDGQIASWSAIAAAIGGGTIAVISF
jgi:hypothetical protein